MFLVKVSCFIVIFIPYVNCRGGDPDYWTEGFDEKQNCKEKKVIKKLKREDPNRCSSVSQGDIKYAILTLS